MSDRIAAASVLAAEAAHDVAESTVDAYIATWNETDAARRQAGIARAWSATGRYRDPVMASDGPAEIDAMLGAVQARFPGFVLKRTSKVDSHVAAGAPPSARPEARPETRPEPRYVRFSWSLGPEAGPTVVEGVDFCALDAEGKLESVVGFIDKMPAA